jgi:3-dehydroquinate synthase
LLAQPAYFIFLAKKRLEKIILNTAGYRSQVLVGESWENSAFLLPQGNAVIITDDNVFRLYGNKFPSFPVFSITPGEDSKRLAVIEGLAEKMLDCGVDRSGFVLAVGGGVVCDIAGFLASIYMRGIKCGYISTTLLSQVDASTGGKNGVNLVGAKNMLGTITQPDFVVCDQSFLLTLPEREYLSGLAELIKTAIIGDEQLFNILEKNADRVLQRDTGLLSDLVAASVRFKARVVTEDEREAGLRKILNFGHTFGHAIEMYSSAMHGFAVASGMELSAWFSFQKGLLDNNERDRITSILARFGLLEDSGIPADIIKEYLVRDKKKSGSDIHFVFTGGIGKAFTEKIPIDEAIEFYRNFKSAH